MTWASETMVAARLIYRRCLLLAVAFAWIVGGATARGEVTAEWAAQPTPPGGPEPITSPLDVFGGIEQPATFAPTPPAPSSLLLERLAAIPAPAAAAIIADDQPEALEAVQLISAAPTATSTPRVRRSPVAMQPTIRGYQQQSVLGQYQGAQFVPVRYDLDSVLTSIDPEIVDNLIVIPGPYGLKYGPGLAFVDLVATPLPRSDSFFSSSRTNVVVRSNGGQVYGRETVTASGSDYGVRASYGRKTGSDYRSGDGTRIPASYNVADANVAIGFDLAADATLQFEYLLQEMTDTEFAGLAFDARQRKTEGFFLRYSSSPFEDVQWLAEGWHNRTLFDGDNLAASKQIFYQPNPVYVPQGTFLGVTDADVASSGARLMRTVGNSDAGRLATGVDFRLINGELNEFDDFDASGVLDPFPIPNAQTVDAGVFAEATVPVLAASTLTVGGRVDWTRVDQPGWYSVVDPGGVEQVFDLGGDFAHDDQLYHAFVSLEHPWTSALTWRLGFGHGQRAPNLTERFALDPFLTLVQNATSAVIGDPNLKPERASQVDLALVGDFEFSRFQLNGYWSQVRDHITLAPAAGVPPDPDLRLLDFVNHDATLAGVEAFGEVDLTSQWSAFGRLSAIEGRNRVLDEPLPNIYPVQSRFGVRWQESPEDRWGVEFSGFAVGRQNRVATALFESPTAGFATWNLRGYYQASDSFRMTAGIDNLFDRNYLEHLSVHNPLVLEPGFNFYCSAELTL